jgi:hypothetical protein
MYFHTHLSNSHDFVLQIIALMAVLATCAANPQYIFDPMGLLQGFFNLLTPKPVKQASTTAAPTTAASTTAATTTAAPTTGVSSTATPTIAPSTAKA